MERYAKPSAAMRHLLRISLIVSFLGALIGLTSCHKQKEAALTSQPEINITGFGALSDGQAVSAYELRNAKGMSVTIMDLGATILSLRVPDKNGHIEDVVLGYGTAQDYLDQHVYMGSVLGRYAGRIADGRFRLDGADYVLAQNNGPNNLHGGNIGFDQKIWSAEMGKTSKTAFVTFSLTSLHLDEGFPGRLDARVTYSLNNQNQLIIDYAAEADRPTHVNLSQHSYFNLEGESSRSILDHELMIKARAFTPLGAASIPTGKVTPLAGTPLDFQTPKPIGRDINADHEQMVLGSGYDHNFVLDGGERTPDLPPLAAILSAPLSGRVMTLYTDMPGVQFYSGNFLRPELIDRAGQPLARRAGLCLETQYFPDSPNKPQFPSTRLDPGQVYKHRTVFEFSVHK